jgi:predicted MPP superfamily phosphohydrolase
MPAMKNCLLLILLLSLAGGNATAKKKSPKLRFAFMTDIHLNKANDGEGLSGLKQALEKAKTLKVDFIVLGGDLVDISGMGHTLSRAQTDSLYTVFKTALDRSEIACYPTIGNHDRYFNQAEGSTEGDEVFKTFFKNSYYTFEKNGIRFFVINSVQQGTESGLFVNEKQMEWIRRELANVSPDAPIILSTHVPVYSIYYPVVENRHVFADVIANGKALLKTFENHNLKLVLQGLLIDFLFI